MSVLLPFLAPWMLRWSLCSDLDASCGAALLIEEEGEWWVSSVGAAAEVDDFAALDTEASLSPKRSSSTSTTLTRINTIVFLCIRYERAD